jgi:hypothetical protein
LIEELGSGLDVVSVGSASADLAFNVGHCKTVECVRLFSIYSFLVVFYGFFHVLREEDSLLVNLAEE